MRLCAGFLLCLLAIAPAAAAPVAGPAIVFDHLTADAGTVTQGETVSRVFRFTNRGKGVLEIAGVRPT